MWWLIGALALACPLLLYLAGRRSEGATMRDWEMVLTPRGERIYMALERRVRNELELADITYHRAAQARELGSTEEALRLLDMGCKLIERFAPTMVRSLAAMGVLSRMVAAMAPMPPLRPRDFQVGQLANLAHLNRFLHHFLVSTAERFRLRLSILSRGFSLLGRLLFRATHQPEPAWNDIVAIQHDVAALSNETLESFRSLLISLAAEQREGVGVLVNPRDWEP
jgi:hypothetical protein